VQNKINIQVGIHFYKPFTDIIQITEEYQGKFFSLHLYKYASKFLKDKFGLALYQSPHLLEDGEKLWAKLESKGYSCKAEDGQIIFLDKDE
jgi:hypothetical protein